MAMYSFEDKCFVEQFVTRNSLDAFSTENEEKWQELGKIMNRNPEDLRKMYQNWKYQNHQSQSANELETNGQSEYQDLRFFIEASEPEEGSDKLDYVDINGQLLRTNEMQYLLEAPQPIQIDSSVQFTSSGQSTSSAQPYSEKRPREEAETNSEIVKIFDRQVKEELELKRQELEEKRMVYKQKLIQGEELHKEKMKILRAKLRTVEENVESIDNVICNRRLTKKFKSGPI